MPAHRGSDPPRDDIESIEMRMLLEAVYQHYGYDFRRYARGSLRRRLWRRADAEGVKTISGLQERVLHNPVAMDALLMDLSVNVTAMFRDPTFYLALREKVVPILRTYPFIRIWNAGCSTGEEVYSVAILLQEEGLLERARIYATDINERVLERAHEATIPLDRMQTFTQNYHRGGGTSAFSEYYKADRDQARIDRSLLENVVFAHHNLVSDRSFNEFHLIICRNVMIYFDKELQDHVHELFYESLVNLGIIALGNKESIRFSSVASRYDELDAEEKIYRRAE
ncbi:MAG: protein-glutamate O-methyltransferase CheR [Actinomycetota bacterium]|nr:protein-glutamate O-methyltransferase CheR [Actinomycetota bacterium]